MEILIKAVQLILSLSILVLLHEGGHFFFAKLFKTRVTRFYLFANYKFHLFSTYDTWFRRLLGKKPITERDNNGVNFFQQIRNCYYKITRQKDKVKTENVGNRKYDDSVGTEYGIGWLPIGGYCQIDGMIDETQDKDKLAAPPQPWEFRSKPAWQRLLIMIGGVLVNFLLALFIYSMVLFTWGETVLPMQNVTKGFKFNAVAQNAGFRDGDIPVAADGEAIVNYVPGDVLRAMSEAKSVTVVRDGKKVDVNMPAEINLLEMVKSQPQFMRMLIEPVVDSVIPNSPAAKCGLVPGDTILAINKTVIASHNDFQDAIMKLTDCAVDCSHADSLRLRNVQLVIARNGETDTLKALLTPDFMLGFVPHAMDYKVDTVSYSLLASFPAGTRHAINVLGGYVSDMKYIFTKDGAKSVGGFGTIGSIFPSVWDWQRFWELTAFLSIILAFMNILPIPALDGGHVLFLLYEIILRRKPSDNFMERAQMVGMLLLLVLMIWANFNDILRFFF